MDLVQVTESYASRQYDWMVNDFYVQTAETITVLIPTAGDNEADLYPDGFIKSGTLLAKYASGANSGLWTPYVSDDATATSLDEAAAVVLDGFEVRKKSDGTLASTVTAGAAIMGGTPQGVILSRMPATLDADNTTNHTIVAADLPTAFAALSLS